ncbi:MAG: PH domain-containing protein [Porticoccaceae bacterium]|nr:PH domain-containing protein [Porticoccaceae bacterium]MDG1474831.1 PH domain-containing protein [Porticoccaceae bacterium]
MRDLSNDEIDLTTLSAHESINFIPMSGKYVLVRRVLLGAIALSLWVLWAFAAFGPWPMDIIAPSILNIAFTIPCLASLSLVYAIFADPRKGYALREHDLSYRSGLFFLHTLTQPLTRIQHVEINRGPLQRRYGLAELRAYSAGGQASTFAIPGLSHRDARQLREFIVAHKTSH